VDFFTPVVDDPYWFGQIAAANALSDVYAMGGVPKTAMNLVCFPVKQMDISVLRLILKGGIDKIKEAGVVLVGGHSVEDSELKYGLSVTGLIHPKNVLKKQGIKTGDRLILTKPLGTGLINTAIKGNIAPVSVVEEVTHIMAALNRDAAEIMQEFPVNACTDITGFGFLGHLAEMIQGTKMSVKIQAKSVPFIPEALEYAKIGFVPAGTYKNKEFRQNMVEILPSVDPFFEDILFDPQTSGGLLICVDEKKADQLLEKIRKKGMQRASVLGTVFSDPKEIITVA